MAIIKTPLSRGPRNYVMHVFFEQDGTDQGELKDYVLIDPVEDFGIGKGPKLSLVEAWYSFVWFDITIKYHGLVPRPVWTLARDTGPHIDFRFLAGLADRGAQTPPLPDDTGRILVSSSGYAQVGSQGTLVLTFKR